LPPARRATVAGGGQHRHVRERSQQGGGLGAGEAQRREVDDVQGVRAAGAQDAADLGDHLAGS
jgi:hypothetical protein